MPQINSLKWGKGCVFIDHDLPLLLVTDSDTAARPLFASLVPSLVSLCSTIRQGTRPPLRYQCKPVEDRLCNKPSHQLTSWLPPVPILSIAIHGEWWSLPIFVSTSKGECSPSVVCRGSAQRGFIRISTVSSAIEEAIEPFLFLLQSWPLLYIFGTTSLCSAWRWIWSGNRSGVSWRGCTSSNATSHLSTSPLFFIVSLIFTLSSYAKFFLY